MLIDCGLSAREVCARLASLNVGPQSIDAILVTHEHSDHVKGLSALSRKYKIPVFANRLTRKELGKVYAVEEFRSGENFWVGGIRILPFSIEHDAADPVGFVFNAEGLKFAQATDLGRVTPQVQEALSAAHALVLESNHDQQMLKECSYPWELKRRIASSHGHLSNDTAASLCAELLHSDLQHVVLGHLSQNSNTPQLALGTFRSAVPAERLASVLCASVAEATPAFVL